MQRLSMIATALVMFCGACASAKHVYRAGGTTVTADNKLVTVRSKDGTMRVGPDVVDPASLGVPIYTDASEDGGAVSVSRSRGTVQTATFTTPDSFQKVVAFYASHMPAGSCRRDVVEGESSVAEFVAGGRRVGTSQTAIMITRRGDRTAILITKGSLGH